MELIYKFIPEKEFKKIAKWPQKFLNNLHKGLTRALLHLEGNVSENLSTGKYNIKTRTGRLTNSFQPHVKVLKDNFHGILGTKLVYARIQEEGGKITITKKMAGFAWYKYSQTGETMWRAIALKKGGQIKIPAHWYLRNTFKTEKNKMLSLIENVLLKDMI